MTQRTVRAVSTRRQSMCAAGTAAAGAWWLAACGAAETPAGKPITEPITITYGNDWSNANKSPIMKAALEAFARRYPLITVKWNDLKSDTVNLNAKLTAQFASGTPDDVLLLPGQNVPYHRDQGNFVDLAPYLKSAKIDLKSYTYIDPATSVGTKLHFLPFSVGTTVWYVNKTLFQRAGVPLPNESWTWNDAADAARRISKPDENIYGFGPALGSSVTELLPLIYSNGGHHISADFKQTQLTQPAALEAIVWVADRITRDLSWVPPDKRDLTGFNNGNVAMEINGIGGLGSPNGTSGRIATLAGKFEWDIMLQPKAPRTGKRVQTYQQQPNGVVAKPTGGTARIEAGFTLAQYLAGEDTQLIIAKDRGNVPALRKLATTSPYIDPPPASMPILGKTFDAVAEPRLFNGYDDWVAAYTTALFDIWSGKVSANAGAQLANAAGDAVLARLTRK